MSSLFTRRSWRRNGLLDKPVNQRIPSSSAGEADGDELAAESIKRLARYIEQSGAASVLDCGPFNAQNFRVLSEAGCTQVHYADLYETHRQRLAAGDDMTHVAETIFAGVPPIAYEFIFLWDIPNYLDRQTLRNFLCVLSDKAAPGACMSIFVHTRRTMPSAPLSFRFVTGLRAFALARWPADDLKTPSPGIRRADIESDCYPFVFDRSFLCRHGLQENLLLLPNYD